MCPTPTAPPKNVVHTACVLRTLYRFGGSPLFCRLLSCQKKRLKNIYFLENSLGTSRGKSPMELEHFRGVGQLARSVGMYFAAHWPYDHDVGVVVVEWRTPGSDQHTQSDSYDINRDMSRGLQRLAGSRRRKKLRERAATCMNDSQKIARTAVQRCAHYLAEGACATRLFLIFFSRTFARSNSPIITISPALFARQSSELCPGFVNRSRWYTAVFVSPWR